MYTGFKLFAKIAKCILSILPTCKLIIFESHSDFCDSTKEIFDCAIERGINKKYKIIWLVDNPDNFAEYASRYINVKFVHYPVNSLFNAVYLPYIQAVAKYCLFTHRFIGNPYKKGQVRFFVTHASPPVKNSTGKFWDVNFNTHILSTSDFAAEFRCKTLSGGNDRIVTLGLPRNDRLFDDPLITKKAFGIDGFSKFILWMPTFKRQKNKSFNDFKDMDTDISLMNDEFFTRVNKLLNELNMLLIVKFHPSQDMSYVNMCKLSNIMTITNEALDAKGVTLYSLLGASDALVTDFSSVYFDYLLADKPIAFELTDAEEYEKDVGFILDNPADYMPGDKIRGIDDFMSFIQDVSQGNDVYREERKKLKDLNHIYQDNRSAERVADFLWADTKHG